MTTLYDPRPERWPQFTLRGLLIVVTLAAVLSATVLPYVVAALREWSHPAPTVIPVVVSPAARWRCAGAVGVFKSSQIPEPELPNLPGLEDELADTIEYEYSYDGTLTGALATQWTATKTISYKLSSDGTLWMVVPNPERVTELPKARADASAEPADSDNPFLR